MVLHRKCNRYINRSIYVLYTYVLYRKNGVQKRLESNRNLIQSLQSGLYYEIIKKENKVKTKLNLKMYFSQLICWLVVVTITKSILFSFQFLIPSFLETIGEFLLSPLKGSVNLKLVFIMIIIPGILNATQVRIWIIQFWIQDNILKFKGNDEITSEKLCSEVKSETGSETDSSDGNKTDSILTHGQRMDSIENQKL